MKLKIIISFLVLCNITIYAQNNEYKEQIGEKFYELGLKTKLKKVDVKDVYKLNYIGYQKMDNMGLNGVNIINNLKTLKKLRGDNYITYTETELFLNEKYQNTNPAQRVAYSYTISQMGTESNIFDTLIVFNIVKNINGKNITMPFAFLMSDYRVRDKNVIEYNQRKQQQIYEKKIQLIDNAFAGNEKLIFPNDSVYVYVVRYKKVKDHIGNKISYPHNTIKLTISNSKDLNFIKGRFENENIDEIFLHKTLYYKDLYAKEIEILNLKNTSVHDVFSYYYNETQFEINDVENFNKYNDLQYWIEHANKFLKDKISTSKISLSLYSINNSVCLFLNEYIDTDVRDNVNWDDDNEKHHNRSFCKLIESRENGLVFNNKYYDLRIDEFNSKFALIIKDFNYESFDNGIFREKYSGLSPSLLRYGKTPYGLNKENVVRFFASEAFDRFQSETESNQEAVEAKKKEEEEVKKYYKKYGKKYVDAALDFDIIVGMHEDLLPYPLKLWSISSRSDFRNGYHLYLYSMLDTSVHLYITVKNHKVSYVSVW